jgi:hypothetical protein
VPELKVLAGLKFAPFNVQLPPVSVQLPKLIVGVLGVKFNTPPEQIGIGGAGIFTALPSGNTVTVKVAGAPVQVTPSIM